MCKTFSMKNFNTVEDQFENFRNHIRFSTAVFRSNYESCTSSCIMNFGTQYIMGRVLSCSVILMSRFLQYLMLVSISFSLEFCVCEYVNVKFIFILGETSANSTARKMKFSINNFFSKCDQICRKLRKF